MSTIRTKLNLVPGGSPGGILPEVRVSQNDAIDRVLEFELFDGAEEADLSEVEGIYFGGTKPDGNGFTVACENNENNIISGILTNQSTALAGNILCKLYLIYSMGSVRSATFTLAVDPDPLYGAGSSNTDIQDIIAAASMYAQEAQASAESIEGDKEEAAASAEAAAESAEAAEEQANRAKSWAVPSTDTGTSGNDTNNSKYWSDRARQDWEQMEAGLSQMNEVIALLRLLMGDLEISTEAGEAIETQAGDILIMNY